METLISDIKYGLRLIIKNPVFSLVVVVALALGIGAKYSNSRLVRCKTLCAEPVFEQREV